MDEESNFMGEGSSGVEYVFGDPKVEPRVGDEYQVEVPPMMSASKRARFLSSPLALDDSSYSFLTGQPLQVMWIEKQRKGQENGDDDNIDMNQSLRSLRARRNAKIRGESEKTSESKKQVSVLEAVPELPSTSWEDFEVASFVLGLYTFGKDFTRLKKFMESKGTGEIVLFYYVKFYNSAKYRRWSDSIKKRNRKCVTGRKLYTDWRQQQLLSRLIPSLPDESNKQKLVDVSKSFAEGKTSLESYITSVKDLVGLKLLVEAVAIGKEKEDLTVAKSVPMRTKPWFTLSSKPTSVPAYTSLTSADIINQLTGTSRLSKARCNDIFYEAVWPRLLARGWRSEQPEDRGNIVFIIPGVKRFLRRKLVKGDHYFDSVSDILTKVASEPELLEFETGGEAAENSSEQSDDEEDTFPSVRYLKSPSYSRGNIQRMQFTVVDSSLAAGGKLCDLRNLNADRQVSEPKTRLGEKDSSRDSKNVEKSQMMPLEAKNQVEDPMRFMVVDTSREKLYRRRSVSGMEEEEKVKDPAKRLVKHKLAARAEEESNYHSVDSSSPLLKRRRLSACIRREESFSREIKPLSLCDEMNEDKGRDGTVLLLDHMDLKKAEQSKRTGTRCSNSIAEVQEASEIKPNGLTSIPGVDNNCSPEESRTAYEQEQNSESIDLKQEQAVKLPSISGSNTNDSSSNDLSTSQRLGSTEQQQSNINMDGFRRQSTRRRPLTTRALEALESEFLITKSSKSRGACKPRKQESPRKKKGAHVLSENKSAELEDIGEEDRRSVSVKNTTVSKSLDETEGSKPVVCPHPKLPPIVLKLLKRG